MYYSYDPDYCPLGSYYPALPGVVRLLEAIFVSMLALYFSLFLGEKLELGSGD